MLKSAKPVRLKQANALIEKHLDAMQTGQKNGKVSRTETNKQDLVRLFWRRLFFLRR